MIICLPTHSDEEPFNIEEKLIAELIDICDDDRFICNVVCLLNSDKVMSLMIDYLKNTKNHTKGDILAYAFTISDCEDYLD